jgi:hypothetical protein
MSGGSKLGKNAMSTTSFFYCHECWSVSESVMFCGVFFYLD